MNENEILNLAAKTIREGGVILHPTETVWGLACDATNKDAVDKLSAIKKREPNKSYIILLKDDGQLTRYVKEVPEVCWDLIDCAEKPITIIYPEGISLAPNVCAEDGSIAIRIPNEKSVKDLLLKCNKPLITTSANLSGDPTPHHFDEISESIKSHVDYIVNLPSARMTGTPSSVIKVGLNGDINIIRK